MVPRIGASFAVMVVMSFFAMVVLEVRGLVNSILSVPNFLSLSLPCKLQGKYDP